MCENCKSTFKQQPSKASMQMALFAHAFLCSYKTFVLGSSIMVVTIIKLLLELTYFQMFTISFFL